MIVSQQMVAALWIQAAAAAADTFLGGVAAAKAIHIGCRSADIADGPVKIRLYRNRIDLLDNRAKRTRLDPFPLVGGDGAESTATETATMGRDRMTNL